MGERLIENCHLYFTDLSGKSVDLGEIGEITGKIEEVTNNISLGCDEENPPIFNMTIPGDTSVTLNVDEPIDWSALTTTIDNVITLDTKVELTPELESKIASIVEDKLKQHHDRVKKEKTESKKSKTNFWCEKFIDYCLDPENFDFKKLKKDMDKKDSLDSLSYAIEAICKGLQKSKEVGISAAEAIEKFAEKSKLVYNKEKETKGEEMEKSNFALPIVGVQFQGSTKTYAYFVTKEVLETYFEYIRDCRNVTKDCLPLVTIQNEVGYNYKNSKVKFIGLAKTPMMLNCPTHIITRIYDTFSYGVSQEDGDFCPFEKCNLAGKDWFEKITIYPVPKTLCDEYFNSKYWKITDMDFSTLKTYNDIDETKIENIKGDNKMNFNKIFPNAEIGKATDVKMSIYGPAFCTADKREIAFKDSEWTDVSGFTFDLYPGFVCPVKVADIAVGDFIKHRGMWCRVIGTNDNTITAENVYTREVITILPAKSMFGFDFYSKLILPFGDFSSDIGDVFSNPFMTMMLFGGDSKDFNDMLPLMLMSGGKFDMSNPMMLYFLMKGDKESPKFELGF